MCFHFQQTQSVAHFANNKLEGTPLRGVYNGFDFPLVSATKASAPHRLESLRWGLIPRWAKSDEIKKYTLNARLETLHEKPSFREAKRCVIYTDGFYEWQWLDPKGKRKQKHLLTFPPLGFFAFAGLYDEWVDTATGEIVESCSIVTTQAQGIMEKIHNSKLRMPVALDPEDQAHWLNRQNVNPFVDFEATAV